jgi:hypothetical protein
MKSYLKYFVKSPTKIIGFYILLSPRAGTLLSVILSALFTNFGINCTGLISRRISNTEISYLMQIIAYLL